MGYVQVVDGVKVEAPVLDAIEEGNREVLTRYCELKAPVWAYPGYADVKGRTYAEVNGPVPIPCYPDCRIGSFFLLFY